MSKNVGLALVNVPEETLGMSRFIFNHCGVDVQPVPVKELRDERTLRSFRAILFPGGGAELYHRDLGKAGIEGLKRYVSAGGGCVGICAGCTFLLEIGLLTGRVFNMPGLGIYRLQNRKTHPIFRDHSTGSISMLRINGPLIEVQAPTRSIADYDPSGRYACIVVRSIGKGRVVGFSAHPEGGLAWGGGDYNPWFYFDGKVQNTVPLLHRALAWVQKTKRESRNTK